MLTVSTDTNREMARLGALKTLLHETKPPFPVLLDPESSVVRDKYGTTLFPETWIIDPKGVIRARFDGARDWSNAMVLDLIESIRAPHLLWNRDTGRGAFGPRNRLLRRIGATG